MKEREELEVLARDIRRQAHLIAESIPGIRAVTADAASGLVEPASRVYLVGCGDSLDAGMAVRYAWERLLGVPAEPVPALSFGRYLVEAAPTDSLVVALSQSGRVTRVTECVRVAQSKGMRTVTITADPDSALARERSSSRIVTAFPKLGSIPGTASYLFNMVLLFELGGALAGVWKPSGDPSTHVRRNIDRLPSLIDEALEPSWDVARRHAAGTADRRSAHLILGAGPNLATARFAARKLYEIPQLAAMAQESEEYAHDQYSMVGAATPTVLLAPPGVAARRSQELLRSLAHLGAPVALVTEKGFPLPEESSHRWTYELPSGLDEEFSPLLYALPAQVYGYELAKILGGSFYGNADPIHRAEGDPLIYESEMLA